MKFRLNLPIFKLRPLEELKRLTEREAQLSAALAQLTSENADLRTCIEALRADIEGLRADIEKLSAAFEATHLDNVALGKQLNWGLEEGRKTSLALFERIEKIRKLDA